MPFITKALPPGSTAHALLRTDRAQGVARTPVRYGGDRGVDARHPQKTK